MVFKRVRIPLAVLYTNTSNTMDFNQDLPKGYKDFVSQYKNTLDELKLLYQVEHVVNYDQLALYSSFKRLGLDFHSFEKSGNRVYTDGKTRVLAIDFKFYHEYRRENILLSGSNCNAPDYHDRGEFYDKNMNLILPIDSNDYMRIKSQYEQQQVEKTEWAAFEEIKPDLYKSELGTQFEIGETVYDYFLEVLPPIYGENCFYCSEPVRHTREGKKVYHCLRKTGNKFTIEENTVS